MEPTNGVAKHSLDPVRLSLPFVCNAEVVEMLQTDTLRRSDSSYHQGRLS